MTGSKAHRIIMLSMLATFTFGFIHSFTDAEVKKHGKFPSSYHVRLFVGASVVFITLSAIADVEPELAAPFAVLIGATATVTEGAPVINQLLKLAGSPDTTKTSKTNIPKGKI
jgi:Na+-transporting methylmalonyl-CoA/oxaloacetate decarboxylase beta subunit